MQPPLLLAILALFPLAATHGRPKPEPPSIPGPALQTFVSAYFDLRRQVSPTGNLTLDASNLFTTDVIAYSSSTQNLLGSGRPPATDTPPFATSPAELAGALPGMNKEVTETTYFLFTGDGEHRNSAVWHWRWTGVGDGGRDVLGFTCFDFQWEGGSWKAWRLSEEFDSLGWEGTLER